MLFMMTANFTYAQVRGTVKDKQGEPIPGANVFWMGTTSGVTSSAEGRFSIEKPAKSHMLVVSFIGFVNDTIHVEKKNASIDVVLHEGVELSEVSVVSRKLGTMKMRNRIRK